MKNKFYISSFVLALMLLSSCGGKTTSSSEDVKADMEVAIKIDPLKANKAKINPFIYGTFIEHIETCIYNGIWSEIIQDRKFVAPLQEDISQWQIVSGEPVMETINPFEGEYSVKMPLNSCIKQIGLAFDKKGYVGYINAKGNGTLLLTIKDSENSNEVSINVNSSEYKKYEFHIDSTFQNKKGQLLFKTTEGEITMDSVSLMPDDNIDGMRKDTLDVLKELNSPFYRWPGGNFVSGYDFYDGIGNRDLRPTKRNINYVWNSTGKLLEFEDDNERLANDLMAIGSYGFYGAFDSNDYGIEEFINMCRYINAEPNIVVNSGYGSAEMAANEVEFCNGSSESTYGKKRLHKDPYNIRIWSVGNEMNGDWQLGHVGITTYQKRHNEFVQAMKAKDPNIEIIAVGDNSSNWSQLMVNECANNMDYLSEHYYAEQFAYDVKSHILSLKNQTKSRISNHRKLIGASNIKMSIDEYAYQNADCQSRLKDGMGVASALNTMIENADVVEIACYSSTVNVTQGNMTTDKFNAYMEGSGYALSLYRNNMQEYQLPVTYKANRDAFYEIAATINESHDEITISVINASDNSIKITCNQFRKCFFMDYVCSDYLDGYNSMDRNELIRNKVDLDSNNFVVEPKSISCVKVSL